MKNDLLNRMKCLVLYVVWILTFDGSIIAYAQSQDSCRVTIEIADSLYGQPRLTCIDSLSLLGARFDSIPDEWRSFQGILVAETHVTEYFPILPYIFFDSASSVIPSRYVLFDSTGQTQFFDENKLFLEGLDAYYHVLNILGSRLRNHPDLKVGIVGCNSQQPGIGENRSISQKRGMSVSDYLRNIWSIPVEQIVLMPARNLPLYSSHYRGSLSNSENRRVELLLGSSITWETDPLGMPIGYWSFLDNDSMSWEGRKPIRQTGVRLLAFPNRMKFKVANGISDNLILRRRLEVTQKGRIVYALENVNEVDNVIECDWPEILQRQQVDSCAEYIVRLIVFNRNGETCQSNQILIPVRRLSQRMTQEIFRQSNVSYRTLLVPIHLDKMDHLGYFSHLILQRYIFPNIQNESSIEIIGHATSTVTDLNARLSELWAEEVGDAILSRLRNRYFPLEIRSVGQYLNQFSNDIPEGRSYNSSIEVVVHSWKTIQH